MRHVYAIRNLLNGKTYIGQSKNPNARKAKHFSLARNGNLRPLYCAIRAYGAENFSFEILESCDDDLINNCEKHWVAFYDSSNREHGYNLTTGGAGDQTFRSDVIEQRRISGRKMMTKLWSSSDFALKQKQRLCKQNENFHAQGKLHAPTFKGHKHAEKTKRAIGKASAIHQQGERNSQFGTVWISNFDLRCSKRIRINQLEIFLQNGWVKGRKIKW